MATTTTTSVAAPRTKTAQRRTFRAAVAGNNAFRNLQLILFAAGAVLMPLGIVVIGLGWYGTAHSHYDYDQRTYLISGGIMGLGLVFLGGFLYFGAWLAKVAADQRDSSRQLADALLVLADRFGPAARVGSMGTVGSAGGVGTGAAGVQGHELVFAGDGTTVHRRDCPLIGARDDLRPALGDLSGATECRVCKPSSAAQQQ